MIRSAMSLMLCAAMLGSGQTRIIGGRAKIGGLTSAAPTGIVVSAASKGPNQVNLTWSAAASPGYGYVAEIQSDDDPRYASYTVIQPIPDATGYTCDPTVVWPRSGTAGCDISDPDAHQVYNPTVKGVPVWVVESQYSDPQDGTPAQFIVSGLKNNTQYRFRVRTFVGNTSPIYGSYSNVTTATTQNYPVRYISTTGDNLLDGLTLATAWASLHKAGGVDCGTLVLVSGGDYSDNFSMYQDCTAGSKVVVQAAYGESPFLATNVRPEDGAGMSVWGNHIMFDGIGFSENYNNDNILNIHGNYTVFFNSNIGPTIIPSAYGGLAISGSHTLLYGNYIHDFGSPYAAQNMSGNGGFPFTVDGGPTDTVVWSNHITRGAHDCGIYQTSTNNRHLNNITDGGWGMAFETIHGTTGSLFEGTIAPFVGALEPDIYKPSFEVSYNSSTVRRGIFTYASFALEMNAYADAQDNLIYNNVFYMPHRCYFQSIDGNASNYLGSKLQNTICNFTDSLLDIYWNTATIGGIDHNSFWHEGGSAGDATIAWYWVSFGGARVSVAYADANYGPPFSNNAALSVGAPSYVDPANMDFHLSPGSPLLGAGTAISDPNWPFVFATPNLGVHQ